MARAKKTEVKEKSVEVVEEKKEEIKPIKVKVLISNLNIRKGPGKNHETIGTFLKPGEYDIIETAEGEGSNAGWGKLASDKGWISLDFVKRI